MSASTLTLNRMLPRRVASRHSTLYLVLQGRPELFWGQVFNRGLLALIAANIVADVIITVPEVQRRYGAQFDVFETVSSILFIFEYCLRLYVAGERPRYRGWFGRLAFATSAEALIDLLAFVPWLIEIAIALIGRLSGNSGHGVDLPATAFIRVLRILRILKTERFVGSVDAITRVVSMNASILGVGLMMALILLLFTSTALYYANRSSDDDDFASIPATMYLSILMLTGQGDPDGDLNLATQIVCAVTAVFSVGMVAIPASMLTFGFEIEATRLAKRRRERRLRRRLRWELKDIDIASSSDSSDAEHDAKRKRRAARRRALLAATSASSYRLCPRCQCCWDSADSDPYLDGAFDATVADSRQTQGRFISELDSSEEEYEELVLGKSTAEAYEDVKAKICEQREFVTLCDPLKQT